MKIFTLTLVLTLTCFMLMGQEDVLSDTISVSSDSIILDTSNNIVLVEDVEINNAKKKTLRGFFKDDYPNPRKAMLFSFAVPGAGQVYNKKYWKAPLAIGGTVAMIIVAKNNTQTYRFLREEYKARVDENPLTIPNPGLTNWQDEDIRRERDKWNKWKEMSYIGLVLIQALGGVDAFVDAHMSGFEINDDLSMKIKPNFEPSLMSGTTLGIGISFQFNSSPVVLPKPFYPAI